MQRKYMENNVNVHGYRISLVKELVQIDELFA